VKLRRVIGGGFIGLEMAENLHRAGLQVSIVEMLDQVMAPLDYEMAQLLHENLARQRRGAAPRRRRLLLCNDDDGRAVTVTLKSGKTVGRARDPRHRRAPQQRAGQGRGPCVNARGGVVTDHIAAHLRPGHLCRRRRDRGGGLYLRGPHDDPAGGPGQQAGPHRRGQHRGGAETYDGTQGTAVAKVFDLTAASTGANEKTLIRRGLVRGKDYETVIITQNSHAGYYPGAVPMTLKLLFAADGKKLFGAQIVGRTAWTSASTRIAVAMRLGASVHDLTRAGAGLCAALFLREGPGQHGRLHRGERADAAWCALRPGTPWKPCRTPCCSTCARTRSCWPSRCPARCTSRWASCASRLGELDKTDHHPLLRHRRARLQRGAHPDAERLCRRAALPRRHALLSVHPLPRRQAAAREEAAPVADSGHAETSAGAPPACASTAAACSAPARS
jgi:hypothetical protein